MYFDGYDFNDKRLMIGYEHNICYVDIQRVHRYDDHDVGGDCG